jgi:putative glutathione S-transferase
MGYVKDGRWTTESPPETGGKGEFVRIASAFRDRITADGSSGFRAEAGRYHLYVGYHCPWAHRTIIYRSLKGLKDAISVSYCLPGFGENGWEYGTDPKSPEATEDEVNGFRYLWEAYVASDPDYTGKCTIPVLWDKKNRRIVNNESSEIIRMLNSEFVGIAGNDADFYPEPLRAEIDDLNDFIYPRINNGVYRCGFATSQQAYEQAYEELFAALDVIEQRLATRRFLVGHQPTEADWRLFTTLVRFDVAYFSLFKCNRQQLRDFPDLWAYTRDLYQWPGVAETVKPRLYVQNYYSLWVNANGIIPAGTPVDFSEPHGRERLV